MTRATIWGRLSDILANEGHAALVTLHAVKGSAPREAGARMAVRSDGGFYGTIGGGQLEWRMLEQARLALGKGSRQAVFLDQVLGPDLGQCCGGRVKILIETFDASDLGDMQRLSDLPPEQTLICEIESDSHVRRLVGEGASGWQEKVGGDAIPVVLFGAGHVGRALALALAPLPFTVRWIDTREGAFPDHIPANASAFLTKDPEAELTRAPHDACIVVMTHDHALDLAVTTMALKGGFPFIGLIGSATKRARFEARWREMRIAPERIAALACPIGLPGIVGKEPAVIAAATVAQLLTLRHNPSSTRS